ncbi:unnamed protein product [Symbiodinium natans]|uniref:Uncharacterized protein n=1 Tax=Symbiodinium natans TaxID=878477 RepID=A0A812SC08_9DINO|nr:unnamed protein product [Symbiodinium natans]
MAAARPLRALALCRGQRLALRSFTTPGGQGNPFAAFEQFGRETVGRATEAASKLGEAIPAQGSMVGMVEGLQGFAQANVNELSRATVPLFAALLTLSRSPGTPLTPEQQEKLEHLLPPPVLEAIKSFGEFVPEDPAVVQLKRIADSLEKIQAAQGSAAGQSLAGGASSVSSSSAPPSE